jgi:uncharacterized membrane protein YdbT with pleckstrin-like domain
VLRLAAAEEVVLDVRPHWRRLIRPAALFPLVVGLMAYSAAALPAGHWLRIERLAIVVAGVLVLGWGSLRPWLVWRGTRLLVTNRRVVVRRGVLGRVGRDLPLNRISDVSFQQRLSERVWGSGTLVVETAGEAGRLVVTDVSAVADVQATVLDLLATAPASR